MNATQTQRLTALQNHSTLYEVALVSPTGEAQLLAYTKRTGTRLRRAVFTRGARIAAAMGDANPIAERATKDALFLNAGWVVKFTGRTERSAIIEGELVRLPEVAS